MLNTPLFVTFEGIDGCGKTTTMAKVADMLTERNLRVVYTFEPSGTDVGAEIRKLTERRRELNLQHPTMLYLYMAARAQNVAVNIRPALEAGKIVLCDRFYDSTLVYQGLCGDIGIRRVCTTHDDATDWLMPNLTLWLDVDEATALERIRSRGESTLETIEDLLRWRNAYQDAYNLDRQRIRRVDSNAPLEEVTQACFDKIWAALCDKFGASYIENAPKLEIK